MQLIYEHCMAIAPTKETRLVQMAQRSLRVNLLGEFRDRGMDIEANEHIYIDGAEKLVRDLKGQEEGFFRETYSGQPVYGLKAGRRKRGEPMRVSVDARRPFSAATGLSHSADNLALVCSVSPMGSILG